MVLIVGAFVQSLRGSIVTWIDQTFSVDLRISPTAQLPLPSGPTLAGSLEDEIRTVPGVALVAPSRLINVRLSNEMAVLRTVSPADLEREHYPVVEGDVTTTREGFARGDTVLISDNLSYRHGVHAGDHLTLDTPVGPRTFLIGAVVIDYALDLGTGGCRHPPAPARFQSGTRRNGRARDP